MSTDIKKRFNRILSIFIQLQSSRLVTAAALADKYAVSTRTIYRDIQSLIGAGIPIYGEAGSGYAIVSEYRLPMLPFTREEALSFLAAEKLVAKYTDKHLSEQFHSAISKMKASLRSSEKENLQDAYPSVLIRAERNTFNQALPEGLSILLESIVSRKAVYLTYLKPRSDAADARTIEPVGIFVEGRFWYVMAFCQLRQDYRQFRLDRIQYIRLTNEGFSTQHRELAYFLEQKEEVAKTYITIRVDRTIAHYLHWDRQHYGYLSEQVVGSEVEMHFETTVPEEGFARWFMMFADSAQIIEPVQLRDRIRDLCNASLKKLGNDT
ncbi:YafY family transcriptional regulator [Sphingobacterium sp. lm-10]|uniref:helix-turn-helix transcriptional regulator n=1 Tax=Sphingobacterium sp. lm-10 TaxID=2944904 RepID=UPI00201FDD2F|nr:YafY family protein [Sphingobacterium sp. lm-10]MCL7988792.1 YafY family transcriptional regulator [Sphingobacterium sp. lm-10]